MTDLPSPGIVPLIVGAGWVCGPQASPADGPQHTCELLTTTRHSNSPNCRPLHLFFPQNLRNLPRVLQGRGDRRILSALCAYPERRVNQPGFPPAPSRSASPACRRCPLREQSGSRQVTRTYSTVAPQAPSGRRLSNCHPRSIKVAGEEHRIAPRLQNILGHVIAHMLSRTRPLEPSTAPVCPPEIRTYLPI